MTVNYRESYGLFACSGILFNHESPRRGGVRHAQDHPRRGPDQARAPGRSSPRQPRRQARLGLRRRLCRAMWLMLQQDKPDDYVVATGETHRSASSSRWPSIASASITSDVVDRPDITAPPRSTSSWATRQGRDVLGWRPEVDFPSLVRMMVDADLARLKVALGRRLAGGGPFARRPLRGSPDEGLRHRRHGFRWTLACSVSSSSPGTQVVPAPGRHELDTADRASMSRWFSGGPDAVIHLAGMSFPPDALSDPSRGVPGQRGRHDRSLRGTPRDWACARPFLSQDHQKSMESRGRRTFPCASRRR